ncbi:MAG: hypothetical protein Q8P12_01105, partial [bacterium]|nr:hypothetical protein [bacterium]
MVDVCEHWISYADFLRRDDAQILLKEGYLSSKRLSGLKSDCLSCIELDLATKLQHGTLEVTQQ